MTNESAEDVLTSVSIRQLSFETVWTENIVGLKITEPHVKGCSNPKNIWNKPESDTTGT